MDYDYGQERIQFEEDDTNNIIPFNGEEEELEDDYYNGNNNNQAIQTQNELGGVGGGGNGRRQSLVHNNQNSSSESSQGKLFVGGISWETTEETFTSYFGKFGEITDSVIMRDKHSGRPRGFGFVTFADVAAADRVLEEDHVIDSRAVEVKRTVPREDMEVKGVVRAKKIFVGGIPPMLTEDDLRQYFSAYGNIVEYQIMLDHKTGRSRGFGFVTFDTEDSVEQIFSTRRTHELGGKPVEIKRAVPKRNCGDFNYTPKSHAGFSNTASGYGSGHSSEGFYGGKMGREYGAYGGYSGYSAYGGYGGGYGNANAFYAGYGGYGYGFGFGGPMMYGGGGYGGSGYGASIMYNNSSAGYAGGKGYGRSSDSGSYGNGKGYGSGAANGGHGSSRGSGGSENGGSAGTSRYHPYQK
ncbi:heterogeneous nuclear ribonucleoprotein 1 [Mercurialis annua]|uniref:heterogeneous nuclear ribonucleoprotein 1 n=1 Tax=Mercurialis annua TaxID=3986 RepID=UPI00215E9376|nr:heterogeneous nuclear ribonucleoprotein 1 [Mercurialis annua]